MTGSRRDVWSVLLRRPEGQILALAGVMCALPFVGASPYVLHVSVLACVYIALSLGLNIVVGLAGLLDLGYVAFYAVGAYTYALLNTNYGWSFGPCLFIGGLSAAAFAILIGWPTIRTRGDYLALVTLGFGEMVRLVLRNWDSVTNGPRGLLGIDGPIVFGAQLTGVVPLFYGGLALAVTAALWFVRVQHSAVGLHLNAIRDDEDAAASIGINPMKWKLYAFAAGAVVAGVAGVFFAGWQRFVSPQSFTLPESILILSIVVLGGMGRFWPTCAAAVFLVLLPEWLRGFEQYRLLVLGLAMIVVVVLQHRLTSTRSWVRARTQTSRPLANANTKPALLPESTLSASSGAPLLVVEQMTKTFGGVLAVDDVTFSVVQGEIVGLIGVNGAGKTTLLGCLSGATQLSSGIVRLIGPSNVSSLEQTPAHVRAAAGVIRTHQQPRLFRTLSVSDNVVLAAPMGRRIPLWEPLTALGIDRRSADTLIRQIGTSISGAAPDDLATSLTFVEAKLVELARAIHAEPRLLLLDETCAGMSWADRKRLAHYLHYVVRAKGMSMIVVEHDLKFLRLICSRFVVLSRGRIIADGPPGTASVEDAIRREYQGVETGHAA